MDIRFKSLEKIINYNNLKKIKDIESIEVLINSQKELIESMILKNKELEYNNDIIEELKMVNDDLNTIQKLKRKNMGYKKIEIVKKSTTYEEITIIKFPHDMKNKDKEKWLNENDFPIKSESYKSLKSIGTSSNNYVEVNWNNNQIKITRKKLFT